MNKKSFKNIISGPLAYLKYFGIVFLAVALSAALAFTDFYISINNYLNSALGEIPLHGEIIAGLDHIMYSKIVVFIVIALGLSLLAGYKIFRPFLKLKKNMVRAKNSNFYSKEKDKTGEKFLSREFNEIIDIIQKKKVTDIKKIDESLNRLEKLKDKITNQDLKEEIETIESILKYVKSNWREEI